MAKGKRDFSVDDFLKKYSEEKQQASEARYGHGRPSELVDSARRKAVEEAENAQRQHAPARYEKPSGAQKNDDVEYDEKPERLGEATAEDAKTPKQMIKNKGLILLTYFLRSFAIALMLVLMVFIVLHNLMGKQPFPPYFLTVGDSFIDFSLHHLGIFALALLIPFLLQLLYYFVYRLAKGKWKIHAREEIVYALLFALVGILCSGVVIWGLGIG